MIKHIAALALTYAASVSGAEESTGCFPDGFLFGSATAAYQVEGAVEDAHRTPSIWDKFCRTHDVQCANVADDFFHRYKADVELMKQTNLDSFRFSVSWSRVMNWDNSTSRMKPNPPGLEFYHGLVDELVANNIKPILTLYHWDLPLELHEDLEPQGWLGEDIVGHFLDYAELMFNEFGDKVHYWSTFNEPWTFVAQGYAFGSRAPGLGNSSTNAYTATHNVLLSHGTAVKRFRELRDQKIIQADAKIGIVLNGDMGYPLNASDPMDIAAVDRKMEFVLGWFLDPITTGDYPPVMRERAGDRLPTFTPEQAELVKGSYDVLMFNHYSSQLVTDCASKNSLVKCDSQTLGWEKDQGIEQLRFPEGARPSDVDANGQSLCNWFSGYPQGYFDAIKWVHAKDPKAAILLTENGWCGNDVVDNQNQLWYHQTYLESVYKAMTEEKINIIGYTAWSFMDNYEWGSFGPRFGLYHVTYPSQTGEKGLFTPLATDLKRTPRPAAQWYAKVAEKRCIGSGTAAYDASVAAGSAPTKSTGHHTVWYVVLGIAGAAIVGIVALVLRNQANNSQETQPLLR